MTRTTPFDVSEKHFQGAVIDLARAHGFTVGHFHDSRRQVRPGVFVGDRDSAGFPDLVIGGHGVVIFAELKREKGKLAPAQEQWRDVLVSVEQGAPTVVMFRLWRPADWRAIQNELSRVASRRRAA